MAGCELKKVVTPDDAKRKAVAYLIEVDQVSQRRAYSALDVDQPIPGQIRLQNAETATFDQEDNASAAA